MVILTVTMENGSSKTFKLIVLGMTTDPGNTLVAQMDTNPAIGVGKVVETPLFAFDANNNSVIENMLEVKTINVVRLTDLDNHARINRESLTLWISQDNVTYTQVKDYKLLQIGKHWYLYDFEATGQYVKVNYTHFDRADADFLAPLNGIILGYWDDSLATPEDASTVIAPATSLRDQTVEVSGLVRSEALRFALEGKLLYHYTENGKIYVRIPEPSATGTALTVWYGGELELSNKEACFEITYGTRQTQQILNGARWLLTVPAGSYEYGTVEKETLLAWGFRTIRASYDGGLTWVDYGTVDEEVYKSVSGSEISGDIGWIFDDETGAMFCISHRTRKYGTLPESDAVNIVFASYDMGKTWKEAFIIEPDTVEGITFTYMITYSGGIRVPSYDGAGSGIDYVFPVACQYTNSGGFCCRVAYSTDAGKTWQMSQSLLTYGENHGNEAGLSEAWIMANDDGVLVLYSRAQVVGLTNFVQAYSYDNGLTWTACETREEWESKKATEGNVIQCKLSSVYSANTQPLMTKYMQENGIGAPLFVWAGNNALGCTTGIRTPLSVAVSYDGLETWRNIQDLFSETFMDVYTMAGRAMVVNQSVAQVNGDTLLITFDRNYLKDKVWMTVTDFEDYFYRTKGAYDGFESGNPFYEGWSSVEGLAKNVTTHASQGQQSLWIPRNGIVARSIPYLQNGTVTLDVYVTAETNVTYALQPAVGTNRNANTLALVKIAGMKLNDSIELTAGWNTIRIDLKLTAGAAAVSANGGEAEDLALDLTVGDYVCYVTAFGDSDVYMDEFCVVSALDAVIYTGEIREEEEVPLPKPSISLTLNESIDMNFYLKKADIGEDFTLVVKRNGEVLEEGRYTLTETADGRYRVRVSINADKMGDKITIQAFDLEGKAISQERTESVCTYVKLRLKNAGAPVEEKAALIRMLDYGTLAQMAVAGGEVENPANGVLTADERALLDGITFPEATAAADAAVGTKAGSKFSVSLTANETIDMNLYIAKTDMKDGYTIQVKRDGKVLTAGQYQLSETADGRIRVRVSVNADKMNDVIEVQVMKADGTAAYEARSLSVRHFVTMRLNNASASATEKAMMIALADYGTLVQMAAAAKSGTTVTDPTNRYITAEQRAQYDYKWN